MKLLLDTHTVLWFYLADTHLSATAIVAIMEPANEKWVSPASYWEIAIKISTQKYALAQPYEDFWRNAIDANGFQILPILPRHTALLTTMLYHHRDPFDRLIVAQAVAERMVIVSVDPILDAYSVSRVWRGKTETPASRGRTANRAFVLLASALLRFSA